MNHGFTFFNLLAQQGIGAEQTKKFSIYSHITNVMSDLGGGTAPHRELQPTPLTNEATAKCTDVPGLTSQKGAPLQQWDCNRLYNQQFVIDPWYGRYMIRNFDNGLCVESEGWDTAPVYQGSALMANDRG